MGQHHPGHRACHRDRAGTWGRRGPALWSLPPRPGPWGFSLSAHSLIFSLLSGQHTALETQTTTRRVIVRGPGVWGGRGTVHGGLRGTGHGPPAAGDFRAGNRIPGELPAALPGCGQSESLLSTMPSMAVAELAGSGGMRVRQLCPRGARPPLRGPRPSGDPSVRGTWPMARGGPRVSWAGAKWSWSPRVPLTAPSLSQKTRLGARRSGCPSRKFTTATSLTFSPRTAARRCPASGPRCRRRGRVGRCGR